MAVEIVFSNEMSRDMDPETAVLTSRLNKILNNIQDSPQAFKLTSSERERHSRVNFQIFLLNITMADYFFSWYIDLHGLIIQHKTSHVH